MNIVDSIHFDINQIIGRKTKLFRDIAKKYKKEINKWDIQDIYRLCELLLESNLRAKEIIAYQIMFDNKHKYNEKTFDVFESWLFKYIKDWWDCDDFMTHAFQFVLMKYPENIDRLTKWMMHERFAVRRSAPVILIVPARKALLDIDVILSTCDRVIKDEHYLVQKGYGWLLKESVKMYKGNIVEFLEKHVNSMSRTAFRYALEKLPKEEKERLMKL